MTLDRNYNIKIRNTDAYSNAFDEIVDLAVKAKEEGRLTDEQMALIISIAIKKQNLKELKGFFNSLSQFRNSEQSEKQTLLIHLKTNRTTYA